MLGIVVGLCHEGVGIIPVYFEGNVGCAYYCHDSTSLKNMVFCAFGETICILYFYRLGDHKRQYISNKRPSRIVILSAAKDLSPNRDPSLRSELALERSEGMTSLKRLRLTRKTSSLKCSGPCLRSPW